MDAIEIELQKELDNQRESYKIQKPENLIHYSDGIYEDFTDTDDDNDDDIIRKDLYGDGEDNESLPWVPYLIQKTVLVANYILSAMDYAGGTLASLFGITTPNYAREIEQFERTQEETNDAEREERLQAYWQQTNSNEVIIDRF